MSLTKPNSIKSILKFSLILGAFLFMVLTMVGFGSVDVKAAENPGLDFPLITDNDTSTIMTGIDLNIAKGVMRSASPQKKMLAVITAYTSTPDQTDSDPFTAASGKRVYDGMIAANGYPFGTKIKIPSLYGDKIFTVDDRMNSRYGSSHFDIWFDSSKGEAMKFGVKHVEVEIYYPEKMLAKS